MPSRRVQGEVPAGNLGVSLNDEDANPKPEIRRGCRAKSCQESEGVPQNTLLFLPPRVGAMGLTDEQIAAPSPPETRRMARNDRSRVCAVSEGLDESSPYRTMLPRCGFASPVPPSGACRGAQPCGCRTRSQIRNPKRVQGFLPAEGSGGVPHFSFSPLKSGGSRGVYTARRLPRLLRRRHGEWLAMTRWFRDSHPLLPSPIEGEGLRRSV